jgi:hypothetical protein
MGNTILEIKRTSSKVERGGIELGLEMQIDSRLLADVIAVGGERALVLALEKAAEQIREAAKPPEPEKKATTPGELLAELIRNAELCDCPRCTAQRANKTH